MTQIQPVEYEKPDATVDIVLLTVSEGRLCVLLVRREKDPFKGSLALPGGYVRLQEDDDTHATARRVLLEKAGIRSPYLEQLYTFSGKFRDPRGWSMSVSYFAVVPEMSFSNKGDHDFVLVPVDDIPALPFDHNQIVSKAVARLRGKSTYSTLPMFLLPMTFTMAELHAIYNQVMGVAIDKVTFRRKIESQGAIEAIEGAMRTGSHRPAQIFKRSASTLQEFAQTL